MNNIRKIIIKQSNNEEFERNPNKVSIYTKRTEQEILKEFEKLGWIVLRNNNQELVLHNLDETLIKINKIDKWYKCKITIMSRIFTMQEHKLLNELFICWGWL